MTITPQFPLNTPYLQTSREFPKDPTQQQIVLSKMYNDVAQATNNRTIGTYSMMQVPTGEKWFSTGDQTQNTQQAYRMVYKIGAVAPGATLTTPHNINGLVQCTHIYGTCITANPDFRPIPYASATVVTNQIEIYVDATNFYVINGATAPAITSGIIVLEYLLN